MVRQICRRLSAPLRNDRGAVLVITIFVVALVTILVLEYHYDAAVEIELAENQIEAVEAAITEKIQIITGGPGTGKSTITNAILRISEKLTKKIMLVAPTGRAAKRMAEICHREAKTIHATLKPDFKNGGGFKFNGENPLDCDLLILDECSMIDMVLMNNVLKAVHPASHLVLVGDADQLPSVGAGNVLRDLIASKQIPVTRLDVIFRQAAGSTIITNAHRINEGKTPLFPD